MKKYKILFIGAMSFGTFFMLLGGTHAVFEDGLLGTKTIYYLQNLQINHTDFFIYLLVRKLGTAFILLLLSNTIYGIFSAKCFVLFEGIVLGMYVTAACMQYHLKGLLFVIGSFFPHQFILAPSLVMLVYWCLNIQYVRKRKPWLLLWILIGLSLGCLLESYVNPILLSDLSKLF